MAPESFTYAWCAGRALTVLQLQGPGLSWHCRARRRAAGALRGLRAGASNVWQAPHEPRELRLCLNRLDLATPTPRQALLVVSRGATRNAFAVHRPSVVRRRPNHVFDTWSVKVSRWITPYLYWRAAPSAAGYHTWRLDCIRTTTPSCACSPWAPAGASRRVDGPGIWKAFTLTATGQRPESRPGADQWPLTPGIPPLALSAASPHGETGPDRRGSSTPPVADRWRLSIFA